MIQIGQILFDFGYGADFSIILPVSYLHNAFIFWFCLSVLSELKKIRKGLIK